MSAVTFGGMPMMITDTVRGTYRYRCLVLNLLGALLIGGLGALLVAAALQWRNSGVVGRWPCPQAAFVGLDLAAILASAALVRRGAMLAAATAVLPVLAAVIAGVAEYRAATLRASVLALPPAALREVAGHVIAGFYDLDEARALARAGIAGLFLSPRNVRGRSVDAITRDVEGLRALRRAAGLPPLWIAADQEGGLVATLSPPLPRPAPLATVASDVAALQSEARDVARQLAALGVNVNFAPVVDVTRGRLDAADRNSRIALRSLSNDPAVVARDAGAYCRTLAIEGVRCTTKHFPGLGDVAADTHVTIAHRAAIDPVDLAPFRQLTAQDGPHPWVMLSHLVVDGLDGAHPASASPALIGLLRGSLGNNGVLITDDAAMTPYRAQLATDAVSTIAGGADLVLASWDLDVAFAVIAALAAGQGDDLRRALRVSDERLDRARAVNVGKP